MTLTTVKIQSSDLQRLDKLKLHKTEPRWSVIERALNKLEGKPTAAKKVK